MYYTEGMSNQPVYRYPPRSHACNCPCPRCAQSRSRPLQSGAWIWPLLAVLGAVSWAAGAAARHPLQTAAAGAGIVILALVTWAVVFLNRRAARPPEGRLRVEAAAPGRLPPPPASIVVPPCYHLDAVPVDLSTGERVAWWCEACETRLPAEFGRLVRVCCGSGPGTRHQYNCPHRKEQS